MASPGEVYEQLRQAYAAADAAAAAGLYAEDGIYYDADNQAHNGRDGVAAHLKGFFATRGPIQLTVKRQAEGDDGVVITEWTSASDDGPRRSTGFPGATVIQVGRSGITYARDYS